MPGVLVADEMGLGMTFTSVAVGMICKLRTEKVVMGLPLLILWGNSHEEWVNMAQNNLPGIIGEEWVWYPLQRLNSVPHCLIDIQITPPQGHPALTSALEPIVVVTMPGVAETFNSVIDEMTFVTDIKLGTLVHAENAELTHEDVDTSLDELEHWWNIDIVSSDSLTSRAKPSSNGQLSYCSSSVRIVENSHRYMTNNNGGWQIAITARIGFKLRVTATLGFQSFYDSCYQTLWLFWGVPEDPEDDTAMEKHGAEALYSAVKSLMHAIWIKDEDAQLAALHRMIQIAQTWMTRQWSQLELAHG